MAIIRMHCEEAPAPPRARNADVSGPLNGLVLRLLEKEPAARPATAAQVAAELAQIKDALVREAGAPAPPAGRAGAGGAGVTAPIACLSLSRDHRHFFVLAGARSLKHRTYWPSQAWYTWHD